MGIVAHDYKIGNSRESAFFSPKILLVAFLSLQIVFRCTNCEEDVSKSLSTSFVVSLQYLSCRSPAINEIDMSSTTSARVCTHIDYLHASLYKPCQLSQLEPPKP